MDLRSIDESGRWLIAGLLGTASLTSYFFNKYVDRAWETDPLNSDSGQWVAVGVAYTLLAAFFILSILYGWQHAGVVIGIIFACFMFSGAPMLFGEMARGRRRRMAAGRKDVVPVIFPEEYVED